MPISHRVSMVTHFIFISLYEIRFQLGMEPSQTPHNPVKQLQRRQMAQALFILNGSNLNMLGTREPAVYGTTTLTEIEKSSKQLAESLGLECDFRQTNHEGILVDWIQEAAIKDAAVIINPAGFSFGCVPVLDALKLLRKPLIEVHITNIHQRPAPYTYSLISQVANGVICGLGPTGYLLAVRAVAEKLGTIESPI
jgi:3-dehydroquinate dehydratase-2